MQVLATRHSWWAAQCEAVLAAEGVPAFWQSAQDAHHENVLCLEVSEPYVAHAVTLLSGQLAEEIERGKLAEEAAAGHVDAPFFFRPAVATGLGTAFLLLVFYAVTGGTDDHSAWFTRGAFVRSEVVSGDWFRLVTASTLHADVPHVLGNAAFFVVLGWAAGEHLGSGIACCVWLITAALGFVASLAAPDISLTVGASGGLFGLLGAAAGHGLRWPPKRPALASRRRLEVFGSAVLLLAFTAFSRDANVYAHVGGAVGGLCLGACASQRPLGVWAQCLGAVATACVVVVAWMLAWKHG